MKREKLKHDPAHIVQHKASFALTAIREAVLKTAPILKS